MLIAVAALGLAVGMAIIDRAHVGVFHDDAMYVILARALATGHGFRYLNLPGAPIASHFPPGYPAVLSVVWRVAPDFPANVAAFKAVNVACLSASAVLVTQLVHDRLDSERWGLCAGIMTAVSVPLLVLVTMVLSEPLFLVLLLTVLLLAERLAAGGESMRRSAWIGVLAGVTVLVRSHGIMLVPAIALPLLARRRWRDAATFTLGTLGVVLPWQLWVGANAAPLPAPVAGNYGSYVSWWMRGFSDMGPAMIPETLRRTVPEILSMLSSLFSPSPSRGAHLVSIIALLTLLGFGALGLRRRAPVTLGFFCGYLALVLVWPFPPARFIWGVWPLLVFVLIAGARDITARDWGRGPFLRAIAAAALLWVAVGHASYELRAVRGQWWASISRSADRRIAPAIAWTVAHTAPSDVVAADDEGAIFLYTGRHAVPVESFTTAHYLRERSIPELAAEGLVPVLATYPVRVVLAESARTFAIAQYLAGVPVPLLALRDQFTGGAAFTVLTR